MQVLGNVRKKRIFLLRLAFMPMMFVAMFFSWRWSDNTVWDFVIEWTGYVFLLLGVALRIWSTLYIGQHKSKKLITKGPFSICRNPLYIGSLLVLTGVSLCFENLVLLAIGLVLIVPIHIFVVLAEEKHLFELFGQQYAEYAKRVPRFGFSLRNFSTPETIEISTTAIYRVTREVMLVLTVPVIGDLIELLHASGVLPILWTY
jgi:protein-S-isoprenylcysteine O-methyltransferase Ste14